MVLGDDFFCIVRSVLLVFLVIDVISCTIKTLLMDNREKYPARAAFSHKLSSICYQFTHMCEVYVACSKCHNTAHWGRATHMCVSWLTIIGSENGLSPDRRQAIIWANTGRFLIGPLETNFSEISIEIHTFSLKKVHLKMSSGKWRPFSRPQCVEQAATWISDNQGIFKDQPWREKFYLRFDIMCYYIITYSRS